MFFFRPPGCILWYFSLINHLFVYSQMWPLIWSLTLLCWSLSLQIRSSADLSFFYRSVLLLCSFLIFIFKISFLFNQHTWDRLIHRYLCFLMLSVTIVPLRLLWEVSLVKVTAAGSRHLIIRMLISIKFYIQRLRPPSYSVKPQIVDFSRLWRDWYTSKNKVFGDGYPRIRYWIAGFGYTE